MKYKLLLVMTIILLITGLFAENRLILNVKIKNNQNIDKELIKSLLAFGEGDILTKQLVSKSIKNLYQLGVFDDIKIDYTPKENGIIVAVTVKEFPIVEEIKFSGRKKIPKSRLKELIDVQKGSYWSPFLQKDVENKILDEYKKKGYYLAKVEFEEKKLTGNRVKVIIKITEGRKIVIKKINIEGNKSIPTKKLLGLMKTKKVSLFRSGKFEKDKFEEDLNKIIEYYNKKGFIDSRIISTEKKIKNGYFYINIYLYEGNSYYFGKVIIRNNKRFNDEELLANFRFKKNEKFNLEKFNKQLQKLQSMYYEEGYIYATFDKELIKNDDRIDVIITINENIRAKVRMINITGNRKTKEKVIRRSLVIYPGDYFSQSKVIKSQQNIYNTGFFEPDISLDYAPINQRGDIDLTLKLHDKAAGTANGGIALNSQDGLVGNLSVSHNNLFGNAWQTGFKWEFGKRMQNIDIHFTNPYFFDTSILLGFDIYHNSKQWSTYSIYTNGGSVRIGMPLILNYTRVIYGYSFYQKKYRLLSSTDEDEVSTQLLNLSKQGWQNTSMVSVSLSRDSRDNVFYPTRGTNISLYSELAGGPLQGDFNYFKQIAQISWFTRTFWKLALRTKWRFGYVTGYGGKEVPPDEKFYPGGTGPDGIRGYPDRSIGPNEGGLREIIFSSEYACPLGSDQIVGLVFFDAGNCFNKFESFNFWKMKKGVGLGIRIQSPMGLIGFDFANNLQSKRWEPHFQFGTTF